MSAFCHPDEYSRMKFHEITTITDIGRVWILQKPIEQRGGEDDSFVISRYLKLS